MELPSNEVRTNLSLHRDVSLNAHQNPAITSSELRTLLALTARSSFNRGLLHGEVAAEIKRILEHSSVSTAMHTEIISVLLRYQENLLREFEPANTLTDGRRVIMLQAENATLRLKIEELEATIRLSLHAGTSSTVSFQSTYNKRVTRTVTVLACTSSPPWSVLCP